MCSWGFVSRSAGMYIVVGECGEHFNVLQIKQSSTGTGFSWLAKSLLTVFSGVAQFFYFWEIF
jgi:hypothetical protein